MAEQQVQVEQTGQDRESLQQELDALRKCQLAAKEGLQYANSQLEEEVITPTRICVPSVA